MAFPQEVHYTFGDLLSWNDGNRYELYDGRPVALTSPTAVHQQVSGELFAQLHSYLTGKPCRAYYAPFDVRLFEKEGEAPEDIDTVVQPDLFVICDRSKVDEHGVHGAPDLVIEILSPSTARQDKLVKFNLYLQAGVREYWIVDPGDKTVQTFVLRDGQYVAEVFSESEKRVPVHIFQDCRIDLSLVFQEA